MPHRYVLSATIDSTVHVPAPMCVVTTTSRSSNTSNSTHYAVTSATSATSSTAHTRIELEDCVSLQMCHC
jgi:hypothetical protein